MPLEKMRSAQRAECYCYWCYTAAMNSDDPMMPSDYEDDELPGSIPAPIQRTAPCLPEGVGRCCVVISPKTKKICGTKFVVELRVLKGPRLVATKHCPRHRSYKERWVKNNPETRKASSRKCSARPEAKAAQVARRSTAEGKAQRKREMQRDRESGVANARLKKHRSKPEVKEAERKKGRTPEHRARMNRNAARRMKNPEYKLMMCIESKVGRMLRSGHIESHTVKKMTSLGSNQDLRMHIESTFPKDGSMHWANYGRKSVTKEEASKWMFWEVGHRIARSMYNPSLAEDVRRCWSYSNIFAQNAKENNSLRVKLPSDDELLSVYDLWPLAWKDVLPNKERKAILERAAACGKQPPDLS